MEKEGGKVKGQKKATLYLSRRNKNTPSKEREMEGVMQGETTQDESLQSMWSESFLPQHTPGEQTAHLRGAKAQTVLKGTAQKCQDS